MKDPSSPLSSRAAGGLRRRARAMTGALLCGVTAVALCGCGEQANGGPLPRGDGQLEVADVSDVGVPQSAGKPFVYGLPIVVNVGDGPAVLERIGVERLPEGLDVLHTYVIGPDRDVATAYAYEWPSKRFRGIEPVSGYTVRPRRGPGNARLGVQLVYVLRAKAPGTYKFDNVTVDYRVGGDHRRVVLPNGMMACITPVGVKPNLDRCPDTRKAFPS